MEKMKTHYVIDKITEDEKVFAGTKTECIEWLEKKWIFYGNRI